MKTTEDYLDDYLDKYNELKNKNELWRLRVTPEKFLAEIERIRAYGIEQRKSNYLNEYHIQRNQEGMIAVMLMDAMTLDEMIEQANRLSEAAKLQFAEEAPEVQKQVKKIQTPLKLDDSRRIYTWLFRKQITLEMLSKEVFEEFSKTRQYQSLINKNVIEEKK
ncbi:MAG: hypothetical protein K1X61_11700 [Chitinophagales bacterium]|nr:hypothetical protein [Chitinophagales bacterium]